LATCPNCGKAYEGSPNFCPNCGRNLSPAAAHAQPTGQLGDLARLWDETLVQLKGCLAALGARKLGETRTRLREAKKTFDRHEAAILSTEMDQNTRDALMEQTKKVRQEVILGIESELDRADAAVLGLMGKFGGILPVLSKEAGVSQISEDYIGVALFYNVYLHAFKKTLSPDTLKNIKELEGLDAQDQGWEGSNLRTYEAISSAIVNHLNGLGRKEPSIQKGFNLGKKFAENVQRIEDEVDWKVAEEVFLGISLFYKVVRRTVVRALSQQVVNDTDKIVLDIAAKLQQGVSDKNASV
jgi:hypothetical protein